MPDLDKDRHYEPLSLHVNRAVCSSVERSSVLLITLASCSYSVFMLILRLALIGELCHLIRHSRSKVSPAFTCHQHLVHRVDLYVISAHV
uniref:Uncharacterized protein n=1 Tax=Arundo donax TaxID=35708 RepID=A0A0A8ZWP0_ARUDO